jgi:hypothetical protein
MGPNLHEGERYAHSGVLLRCDKGVAPGLLTVLPRPSHVNGQFQATTADCLPLVNIPPFGVCAVTRGPCLPPMLLWTGAHVGAKKVGGFPPLLESSVCQCALGGRISITMPPPPGSLTPPAPTPFDQQTPDEQDARLHEASGTLKELAGGLALVGLGAAVGGLSFPPLEIVAAVALGVAEVMFVAAVVIDVAVVHPTVDNWLVVGGDVLALGAGYVVGKVIVGAAFYALAKVQTDTQDEDEKYRAAIRAGRIIYTCNAGWIDMTHAFTETRRNRFGVGARSLWNQITAESGYKSKAPGENGFLVVYRQDAQVVGFLPTVGVTRKYFVQYGLPVSRQEQIAMAIFQEVSLEFEALQAYGAAIGRGDSSFEPADLTSNLLGFYKIIRPELTQERILQLCGKLSIKQSLDILSLYPGTFSSEKYKNKRFTPRFFPNRYCNCTNPVLPAELRAITPAVKGTDFRDWIELFDVHGGRPPMNGPKF